jgi:quinol monooxygenase YgiN
MSVLVIMQVEGDTAKFQESLDSRAEDYRSWHDKAVAAGAEAHQFGVGDGFILVADRWASEEQFHAFFADTELQKFIGEVGGDTSMEPDIIITEAIDSPDKF